VTAGRAAVVEIAPEAERPTPTRAAGGEGWAAGAIRAVDDPGLRTAAWLFAMWSGVLVFSYGAEALARLAARRPPTDVGAEFLWAPFLDAALWTGVTLAVMQLTRWFPLARGRLLRNGAALMLAGLALVPARNMLMVLGTVALGALRSDLDLTYLFIISINQDLFVFWLAVLAIHAVRHSRAVQEREVARAQVETQLAEARLQALKVQIQPHFLFNTLHAIATLVREDPPRAERTVEHLSEMLRTTLTHHQAQEVALREELETLRPYLEIEKMRLGERLEVRMETAPEVMGALVPHLILQPLVENAIRHGISARRRQGWVRVEARGADGWLHLVVEDNGQGMSGVVRPGAIGLSNVRTRLWQLYGDRHHFEIRSEPEEGTRIEMQIPLRMGVGAVR
jgi:two-component sensor histidine kinase